MHTTNNQKRCDEREPDHVLVHASCCTRPEAVNYRISRNERAGRENKKNGPQIGESGWPLRQRQARDSETDK